MQQKPKPVARPALVTQPSPVLLTRNVRRYVATCVVADQVECEFPNRKAPRLHGSKAAAEVESARHLRTEHAGLLAFEVKAKKQRQVVNETLELIAE